VVVLGVLMVERIAQGMVEFHRDHAIDEVDDGRSYAAQRLRQLKPGDLVNVNAVLRELTANLSDRGERVKLFEVSVDIDNPGLRESYVSGGRASDLKPPRSLTDLVNRHRGLGYQYVRMSLGGRAPRPVLAVAAPVDTPAGRVQLNYFFPLDGQVDSVTLVRHVTVGVGVLLVLALSGIAFGAARLLVRPVSEAALTAERLSAGVLTERMPVRGEDEVARLARSFNQMAESLQQQIVQLERYSTLQRRFTSDVSHELRTPLTTIRMAADVLHRERGSFQEDAARSAELLHDQVDHFEALLTDLLEISRYDSGFAVLEPETVDVVELVRNIRGALSPMAERVNVQITLSAPSEPVECEIDSRRVARIVRNLLSNAVEYGRASSSDTDTDTVHNRTVQLTVAASDEAMAITVRDHGIGLATHECDAVFHRFWRGDPSRARHTGGTGLGLSIALEDARLHGGWLQAWGQRGNGAQFRLTLPRRVGEPITRSPLSLIPWDARPEPPLTYASQAKQIAATATSSARHTPESGAIAGIPDDDDGVGREGDHP
jgi:two-component system sensor histidine kinase MtrB